MSLIFLGPNKGKVDNELISNVNPNEALVDLKRDPSSKSMKSINPNEVDVAIANQVISARADSGADNGPKKYPSNNKVPSIHEREREPSAKVNVEPKVEEQKPVKQPTLEQKKKRDDSGSKINTDQKAKNINKGLIQMEKQDKQEKTEKVDPKQHRASMGGNLFKFHIY